MDKKTSEPQKKPILDVWSGRPIFPVPAQSAPTEVVVRKGITWRMGIKPSFDMERNAYYLRGLNMRHADVIFVLYEYFINNNLEFDAKINLSFNKLLKLVGWGYSRQNLEMLKRIIDDLGNIWVEVVSRQGRYRFVPLSFSLMGDPNKPKSEKLGHAMLAPRLTEYLSTIEKHLCIRLHVLNSMRSSIEKAIYLYLPSKAIYRTKENPFRISLLDLFVKIGLSETIPHRKKVMKLTQSPFINVESLNNSLIALDRELCISLEAIGDDYNLCAWAEGDLFQ
jgi:hypothetical protein